jgi:hypothetical protein
LCIPYVFILDAITEDCEDEAEVYEEEENFDHVADQGKLY